MKNNLGNKAVMARNIQYYMDLNNKDRKDVCKDLGIRYTTFTDWVKGNTYPRIDKIELLANYFGITKADLVEDMVITERASLSEDERTLLNDYNQLNSMGKKKAREEVAMLTEVSRYVSYIPETLAAHFDGDELTEGQKAAVERLKGQVYK